MVNTQVTEKARGKDSFTYMVEVDSTKHEVSLSKEYCHHLTGGYYQPEELVK